MPRGPTSLQELRRLIEAHDFPGTLILSYDDFCAYAALMHRDCLKEDERDTPYFHVDFEDTQTRTRITMHPLLRRSTVVDLTGGTHGEA